jgi:tetratricopeptide (TPR) repeat protein
LADIAAYEGRLPDAIAILKKGIAFDLENNQPFIAADKYIFLAQIYTLQEKKELALKAANQAINISKKEEFLFSAAEIYVQTGQEDNLLE